MCSQSLGKISEADQVFEKANESSLLHPCNERRKKHEKMPATVAAARRGLREFT
jgi:hypothetical protein